MLKYEEFIPENGCIIAETACGHEGDIARLKQLIDCVAESGARIIKFQIFSLEERAVKGEKAWDIFSRLELSEEQWYQVVRYAREKELIIVSDIFGEYSFNLARKLGVDGYKIHSEDLLNSYFIAKVAEEGKPLFVGVGGAHRIEIYNLLNFLRSKELLSKVVLMTGIQTFPTLLESHSVEEVGDLITKYSSYGIKVGFSDHISGDQEEAHYVPLMALAKGACIIEKHVTVNRDDKWIDYQSALSKGDFKRFTRCVRTLSPLLKKVGPFSTDERKYRKMFKKSPVIREAFRKGHVLKEEDIEFKKNTSTAIPLASMNIIGKKLIHGIEKGELCRLAHLENKVGGIIVARCTSSRLPNKAIRKIQGRETITLVIDRMKRCKHLDCLILATSVDPFDDILARIAEREGIFVFRGSLDNVSSRFYEAAKHYELDHFVRITGDAILCDEVMVDVAVESHLRNCCDVTFIENMPFGTNKEVISLNAIKTILDTALVPLNTEYLEYYLENERYFSANYVQSNYKFDPRLRITLDYEEDFAFFERVYGHFNQVNPRFTLKDALAWLQENPEVSKINMHKTQKFSSKDLNMLLNI